MLTNYHTHCFRCQHAEGSVEDYVTEAITRQFDKLGMSDHVPYPHYDYGLRMPMSEIWDYIYEVREAQEKYKDRIQVLLGFESEYLCTQRAYYEELLTEYGVDYLILGQHFFDYGGQFRSAFAISDTAYCVTYAKSVREGLGTGYYSLLAHPDIVGVNRLPWDRNMEEMTDIIVESAVRYDIPLEINANGIRRGTVTDSLGEHYMYPHYKFWEKAAEAGAKVVVSADCHSPHLLDNDEVHQAKAIAKSWGLRLIDDIDIRNPAKDNATK